MFWNALTTTHRAPSNGIETIAWTRPPVTTFAVPIVRKTNPQKIPACMSPARRSRNIRVWTNAYCTSPATRRGTSAKGRTGRATANTRRWRAMTRAKNANAP